MSHFLAKRGHSYEDEDWDSGPPADSWANLVVENLKWEVDWKILKELFQSTVKGVKYAKVAQEPDGRSAGHGIVQYQNPQQAAEAMRQLQGYVLHNRPMVIRLGNQNNPALIRQLAGRGSSRPQNHHHHGGAPTPTGGGYGQPQLQGSYPSTPRRGHQGTFGAGMDGMGEMPPVPLEFAQAFMQQQGLNPALGSMLAGRGQLGMVDMGASGYAGGNGMYGQDPYGNDGRSSREQELSPRGRSSYPPQRTLNTNRPNSSAQGNRPSSGPHANGSMSHADAGRSSSRQPATGSRARAEDPTLEARRQADAKRLKPNPGPSWRQLDVPSPAGNAAGSYADDAFDQELDRTISRALSQEHSDVAAADHGAGTGAFRGHMKLSSGRTVDGGLGSGRREPSPAAGAGPRARQEAARAAGAAVARRGSDGAGGGAGLAVSRSGSLQVSPTAAAAEDGIAGQPAWQNLHARMPSPYVDGEERFAVDALVGLAAVQQQGQQQRQQQQEGQDDLYEGLYAPHSDEMEQLDTVEQQGRASDQDVPQEGRQHSRKPAVERKRTQTSSQEQLAGLLDTQMEIEQPQGAQQQQQQQQQQIQRPKLRDQQVQTEQQQDEQHPQRTDQHVQTEQQEQQQQQGPEGEPGTDYIIFLRRLAVDNCPTEATEADLTAHFGTVGPVSEVQLLLQQQQLQQEEQQQQQQEGWAPSGRALVVFERAADAVEALGRLANVEFMGRVLGVRVAPVEEEVKEEPPICQVLVQGLPLSYGEPQVREMMEEAGPVSSVTTFRDTVNDAQVTCANVVFEDAAGAAAAVDLLHGSVLLKRTLTVRLEQPAAAGA